MDRIKLIFVIVLLQLVIPKSSIEKSNSYIDIVPFIHLEETKAKCLFTKQLNDLKYVLETIGFLESSNRYHIYSGQYWGKYQLGELARIDLGVSNIDLREFLYNESLQDELMVDYLKINERYLKPYIKQYTGKTIAGIKITKAGILAGAHLVGHAEVKRFLETNGDEVPFDGNQTPVTKYMKKFQNTKLDLNFDTQLLIAQL